MGEALSVAWSMPSRWTFQQPPIAAFLARHVNGARVIVDPFCGESTLATHRNDLARGGVDAAEFCSRLLSEGVTADVVLFDPPYSPRQISECYKSVGRKVTTADTQNAALYARVRAPLAALLKPGGLALSFGWQSSGFGKAWKTLEILLVQHGGAHNDTICVAQRKPLDLFSALPSRRGGEKEAAMGSEALKVECPHCWAAKGEKCYVGNHRYNERKPHAARIRLAKEKEKSK